LRTRLLAQGLWRKSRKKFAGGLVCRPDRIHHSTATRWASERLHRGISHELCPKARVLWLPRTASHFCAQCPLALMMTQTLDISPTSSQISSRADPHPQGRRYRHALNRPQRLPGRPTDNAKKSDHIQTLFKKRDLYRPDCASRARAVPPALPSRGSTALDEVNVLLISRPYRRGQGPVARDELGASGR